MGGTTGQTTTQMGANPLASLFASSQGYQQQPVPPGPLTAPTYPTAAMTPEQAAMATQQRMLARMPIAAPATPQAPRRQTGLGGHSGYADVGIGMFGMGPKRPSEGS